MLRLIVFIAALLAPAIALAKPSPIKVVVVTAFVIYEQLYNNWAITNAVVKEVSRLLSMAGL